MMDKPNKVTATLKVVVTGEFYDDEATEETLRYTVEQDLEDAGLDVDVALAKTGEWITIWREDDPNISTHTRCSVCNMVSERPTGEYCKWCGAKMI